MLHLQRQTLPGQFGLEEACMTCKTLLAFSLFGSLCVVGCGGSGGGGGSTSFVNSTVTAVSVSCNPTSLSAGQTSQTSSCSASVQGTGSFSNAVTWSASVGTITASGVYTAPATVPSSGSATITATSTQDATKSGTALITITAPPTITSVGVACSPTTVPEGQTSQCTATVQGTGSFDTTVTWAASPGTIASTAKDTATYTAPSSPTGSATVTATASEDTTKSGKATLTVTRTPPSGSWQESGPAGADSITVFAEDPSSPNTIYADGQGNGASGLWKSVDSGTTWTAMITNSDMDVTPISDMAVVNGGQMLYAAGRGSEFLTSTDGGTTWTTSKQMPSAAVNGIGGMAVDPQNNATIYLSAPGLGVVKSVNSGTNWTLLASSPVITAGSTTAILHNPIQVDPTNTNTIYYGTDHGLYISKDGGSTWTASTTGIASADASIRDLAVDPAAPSNIYVLAGLPASTVVDLYESTNAGNSWTPLAVGLDAERVVPDPSSASTIYLYGLQIHEAYKSTDGGHTFAASDSSLPVGSASSGFLALDGPTGTMIPLVSSPNSFLLSIGGSGVYKTTNAAQSWQFSSVGLSAWNGEAIAVDPEVPTTIYFGDINGGGIFKSTDNGATWTNVKSADGISDIAVDPFDSTHILAVSDAGIDLIESHDGGNTWTNISSRLPTPTSTFFITGINFHPKQQGLIFVAFSGGGLGLLRSSDGGLTFTTVNTGLSTTNVGGCLAINPQNPKILLIADAVGLATSTDGGNTWVETASQITCPFSVDTKSTPTIIYAVAPPLSNPYDDTAVRSADFGKTWTPLDVAGPLIADPSTANSVFSVNSWSPDAGTTWYALLTNGLGQSLLEPGGAFSYGLDASGAGMAIAPSSPQVMFVASWTHSLWRFVVGP